MSGVTLDAIVSECFVSEFRRSHIKAPTIYHALKLMRAYQAYVDVMALVLFFCLFG